MMRHTSDTCRCYGIRCCIPCRKNSRLVVPGNLQNGYGKAGFAVERFLVWLRYGLRRTVERHEKKCWNQPGLVLPGMHHDVLESIGMGRLCFSQVRDVSYCGIMAKGENILPYLGAMRSDL